MIEHLDHKLIKNLNVPFSVNQDMDKSFIAFADVFENCNDPMFIIDLDSCKILKINDEFLKNKEVLSDALDYFKNKVEEFGLNQTINFQADGFKIYFNKLYNSDGKALVQILNLEKFNLENKATKSENHFLASLNKNKLLNKIPSGIIFTNDDFESIWYNERIKQLFGREFENRFKFIDAIYIKDISAFWNKINKLKSGLREISFSCVIRNFSKSKEIFIDATVVKVDSIEKSDNGYVFILKDVTENIHFSEEITKQNLALNQINHELDKFLYSVSHNIRGPVASLEGLLKVIEISDVQTVNELKHHLRLNLRLLNGFVNDISNVATNIHTHVNLKEVNLRDLVEQLILFVNNIYNLKPKVTLNIPNDYSIRTDDDRLEIIIKYILKNSFQYRDTGKDAFKIEVSVTQNEDFHLIEITDNGIGIPEKVKPHIFDMFYRGTELSNGNGMGLYNSREILKKIGGTMNVESKDREWTTTKIYLPINNKE
ncbi:PAS domain-containing sensor histidine kinase [Marivirga arenosa]|uniref:histidine kinase n=1 Tax=Marivirga arenosa TaxID=3059076 RepID=A0AA49JHD2_9BACT|nr:PAS domain-containing sensor histidine kinase [Marivirga sp. BKB1-2]WKK79738.2 PAS domain-containing sensor histidine kinase [Marivirga sp. BKB1-2]